MLPHPVRRGPDRYTNNQGHKGPRALAAKSDPLGLIPGMHKVEGQNQLLKLQPWQVHTYTLIQQINKSNEKNDLATKSGTKDLVTTRKSVKNAYVVHQRILADLAVHLNTTVLGRRGISL